jgi:hypothetical protein
VKTWHPPHRNLLAIAIILVVCAFAYYYFVLRPNVSELARLRETVSVKRAELRRRSLTEDAKRLGLLLEQCQQRNQSLQQRSDQVLRRSTKMFAQKINHMYGSVQEFCDTASRLDFQEEFIEIERGFRDQGILMAPEVSGIGENTFSTQTYQLLLQLWTLEKVVNLATENHLATTRSNRFTALDDNGRPMPAAKIKVMPMLSYVLEEKGQIPYVLELPVQVRLEGSMANLRAFLIALQEGDNFLPVSRVELSKCLPRGGDSQADQVTIDLECSSFFLLRDKSNLPPPETKQKRTKIPRGA